MAYPSLCTSQASNRLKSHAYTQGMASMNTVYRIRNKLTGEYYGGGIGGFWTSGPVQPANYSMVAAAKRAWTSHRRGAWRTDQVPPVEIVQFTLTETQVTPLE